MIRFPRYLALLPLLLTASAYGADWKADPATSKLEFIAVYEKSNSPGVFKDFDVRLRFDPAKPAGGTLEVSVQIASADMNSRDMNEAIADPEWFDTRKFAQATFRAAAIKRTDATHFVADGKLTIKGVEKNVNVPFTWTPSGSGATMEGELTLKRTDFNVGTGDWAKDDSVGLDVTVKFKLNMQQTK